MKIEFLPHHILSKCTENGTTEMRRGGFYESAPERVDESDVVNVCC